MKSKHFEVQKKLMKQELLLISDKKSLFMHDYRANILPGRKPLKHFLGYELLCCYVLWFLSFLSKNSAVTTAV